MFNNRDSGVSNITPDFLLPPYGFIPEVTVRDIPKIKDEIFNITEEQFYSYSRQLKLKLKKYNAENSMKIYNKIFSIIGERFTGDDFLLHDNYGGEAIRIPVDSSNEFYDLIDIEDILNLKDKYFQHLISKIFFQWPTWDFEFEPVPLDREEDPVAYDDFWGETDDENGYNEVLENLKMVQRFSDLRMLKFKPRKISKKKQKILDLFNQVTPFFNQDYFNENYVFLSTQILEEYGWYEGHLQEKEYQGWVTLNSTWIDFNGLTLSEDTKKMKELVKKAFELLWTLPVNQQQ